MTTVIRGEKEYLSAEMVIPIPLSPRQLKARSFNQAQLLAQVLRKNLGLPEGKDLLLKVKETKEQVKLSRAERLSNLQGAFVVSQPEVLKDKRVLLVDDVYTTGATAGECTLSLLAAGAREVLVATVASSVEDFYSVGITEEEIRPVRPAEVTVLLREVIKRFPDKAKIIGEGMEDSVELKGSSNFVSCGQAIKLSPDFLALP